MMTEFFKEFKEGILDETLTSSIGTISRVTQDYVDVNIPGQPLLVNVEVMAIKTNKGVLKHTYEVGDRVVVMYNDSDINQAVVTGLVGKADITWDEIGGSGGGLGITGFDVRDGDLIMYYMDGTTPPNMKIVDGELIAYWG